MSAPLGEGAGYKYSHPDLPPCLIMHPPATHFGKDDREEKDPRLLQVLARRRNLEERKRRRIEGHRMELQRQKEAGITASGKSGTDYSWLRVAAGGNAGTLPGARIYRSREGPDLPRAREFKRNPAISFGSGPRFDEKILQPHSKVPLVAASEIPKPALWLILWLSHWQSHWLSVSHSFCLPLSLS